MDRLVEGNSTFQLKLKHAEIQQGAVKSTRLKTGSYIELGRSNTIYFNGLRCT